MTKTNLSMRRVHLYLGMLLLPWVLVYGLSSLVINHGPFFRERFRPDGPQWDQLWTKAYTTPVPQGQPELRDLARRILSEQGWHGAFHVNRRGETLNINLQDFTHPRRLRYDASARSLVAEQQRFLWPDLLVRLHVRGGYHQPGVLNVLWAVLVDLVCVAIVAWVITGIYLWWKLPTTRGWGFLALASGFATFAVLLLTL